MKKLITVEQLRDWLSEFDISHFEKVPEPEQPLIEIVDLMEEPDLIFVDEINGGVILDAGEKVFVPNEVYKNTSFEFYCIALPNGSYVNRLFETVEDAFKYALEEGYEKDDIIQDF